MKGFIFITIIVLFSVAVFLDPSADPPLGATDFEGQILMGAGDCGDAGSPCLGDWRPSTVVPTQTYLVSRAFGLFGRSLETARGLSAAVSVLVLILFTLLVRRSAGDGTAVLAALFLALNPIFFAVSRTALPAVFSLLWFLIAIHLWIRGGRSRFISLLAGLAVMWAGMAENGMHTAFFLGAGVLMAVFMRLHAWKMPWLDATRQRLTAFWVGAGLGAVIILARVVVQWDAYGTTWSHLWSLDHRLIPSNLVTAPLYFGRLMKLIPITTAVALGTVLFYAKTAFRPVARHRRLDEVGLWFLCWLLVGATYFALVAAPPLDALVLLVPPLCAVAADGVARLYRFRRISRPRIDVMMVMVLIGGFNWFVLTWLVTYEYGHRVHDGYWAVHQTRGIFLLVAVLWVACTALAGWFYLRWKKFTLPVRPVPMIVLAVLLGALIPAMGAVDAWLWWRGRTHSVREASAQLASLPDSSVVVGSWAPLLTLDLSLRPVVIWADVNASGQDWYDRVTHLLLQEGREADPKRVPLSLFSDPRGAGLANPLRTIPLGDQRLELYEVVRGPVSNR